MDAGTPLSEVQELCDAVKEALRRAGLGGFAAAIIPGDGNFAQIPANNAVQLAETGAMKATFTTSHKKAWQCRMGGHFAIKLYSREGDYWEIAIITTNWRHYWGAAIFHGLIPDIRHIKGRINLLTARDWLSTQS